ncbi:MAG: hypothetical protein K6G11_08930 [Lachnospiraceae bacterium]|nr:hypothetical protein [Lachnospiraceae bacterium]
MKRIIVFLIVMSFLLYPSKAFAIDYSHVKDIRIDEIPQMNSIKLKWKPIKKVTKIVVYRTVYNYFADEDYPPNRQFKKIKKFKKIKNKRVRGYVDKNVKTGKFYMYYIKMYKGKKLIASSHWSKNPVQKGISMPTIKNDGPKEIFENGKHPILLANWNYDDGLGVKSTKQMKIYRKEKGAKKYKVISPKKTKISGEKYLFYKDTKAKFGKIYYYKAKAFIKKGKKKIYSGFSNTLKIYNGNYVPKLKMECMFNSREYAKVSKVKAVFKLSNDSEYNGKTRIMSSTRYSCPIYNVTDEKGNEYEYKCVFKQYSYNNVKWYDIYKDYKNRTVELPKDKPIYLKAVIYSERDNDGNISGPLILAGDNNKYPVSNISTLNNMFEYEGPVTGNLVTDLDMKTKASGGGYIESWLQNYIWNW